MTTTEPDRFPYATPAAFRAALSDRLKRLAASSPFKVTELQRQLAYDRLLARVFSAADAERWILKGATALLARLEVARHSKDVDLLWQSTADLVEVALGVPGLLHRYKDLVDLVLIARTQRPEAAALRRAILSQAIRRGAKLPDEFQLGELASFPRAMALVKKLLDPIMVDTAVGQWDPDAAAWRRP